MKQVGQFFVLPVAPGTCEVCATKHDPRQPHNVESIYYQMTFANDPVNEGRGPTWKEAMAHCTDAVKEQWISALKTHGIVVEK